MRYAITTVAEREIPCAQWTRTRWPEERADSEEAAKAWHEDMCVNKHMHSRTTAARAALHGRDTQQSTHVTPMTTPTPLTYKLITLSKKFPYGDILMIFDVCWSGEIRDGIV